MNFYNLSFIFRFLPLFLLAYYIIPDAYRNFVLFCGSIIFYAFISLPCTLILLGIIVLNYIIAFITRSRGKKVFIYGIIFNVSLLVFFKCGPFSMPGISFIMFQMIAFQIDSYRGVIGKLPSLGTFGTYAVMFPKLICGPITRYQDISADLKDRKKIHENIEGGLELFVLGLSYKVLLADSIAGLWSNIQTIGFASISVPLAWLGAVGFSLQLYFDFHGYTLMAIGIGKMLGYTFPENFDAPYCSRSVSEFYRRWHITLGRWFKDYIYIPLGGNRAGRLRMILNLLVVWILTGLWHGFGWNFLLWGIFLFCCIAAEKLFLMKYLKKSRILSHIYVLLIIPVSWMFFAIPKISDVWIYLSRLFAPIVHSIGVNVYSQDYVKYGKMYGLFIAAAILFALPWPERIIRKNTGRWPNIVFLFVLFWLSVYEISIGANNPFMYFRF